MLNANEQELVQIEELEKKVAPDQSTAGFLDRKQGTFQYELDVRNIGGIGFLD